MKSLPDGREWTHANTLRWLLRMPESEWPKPEDLAEYPKIVEVCVQLLKEDDLTAKRMVMERVEGKPVEQRLSANVTADLLSKSAFATTIRNMQSIAMATIDESPKDVYPSPVGRGLREHSLKVDPLELAKACAENQRRKPMLDAINANPIFTTDTPDTRQRLRESVARARKAGKVRDAVVSLVPEGAGGAT